MKKTKLIKKQTSFTSKLGYVLYVLVFTVVMLEILLRVLLYEPYHYYPFAIHAEPQQCIIPDSICGFRLNPGNYQVVINQALQFETSHETTGERFTPKPDSSTYNIHIHGCSYTYGFGISDSLTMAYRLQQDFGKQATVHNLAVLGYGNVQSYHLIKSAIVHGNKPDMVIINYASFHDERNALTTRYRKDLKIGFAQADSTAQTQYNSLRFPYVAKQDDSLVFRWDSWEDIYQNFPLREHSALINLLQTISDKWDWGKYHKEELSNLLFLEIQKLCEKHQIDLLVTTITKNQRSSDLLRFCQQQGIATLDISVDLYDVANNNLPYDSHPNGNAHRVFYEKLRQYLTKNVVKLKD